MTNRPRKIQNLPTRFAALLACAYGILITDSLSHVVAVLRVLTRRRKVNVFMNRQLLIIFVLLPSILLGLGYYFVTIPAGTDFLGLGIKQTVWFGIGQSIFASAIVSLLMLVGTWAERDAIRGSENALTNKLAEFLVVRDEYLKQVDTFKGFGIRDLHPNRYILDVYQRYQATVSNHLDLLGMSLTHFQQDVGDDLQSWVTNRPELRIRLLVINPTSPYCDVRDREEGASKGEIARWSMQLTERVLQLNHPRIQVRWYNTLPMANVFRLDDVVFIGTYLVGKVSRLTTTLELDVDKSLAKQYMQHFEDLWSPPDKDKLDWSLAPTLTDLQAAQQRIARQ